MKNILLALTVIVVVGSLGIAGVYASFVDTDTNEGTAFQAGSLDLQLGDYLPSPAAFPPYSVEDEDYGEDPLGDSVTMTWDRAAGYPAGMEPGDTLASRVKIQNWGTIEATSLDIICVNDNTAPPGGPFDKDTKMIIIDLMYHNTTTVDLLDRLKTELGKDTITLDDWELNPITGLTPPPLGLQAVVDMAVLFDPATTDDYQGTMTMMTLIFVLEH